MSNRLPRTTWDDQTLELYLLQRYRKAYGLGVPPTLGALFVDYLRFKQKSMVQELVAGERPTGYVHYTFQSDPTVVEVPIEQYLRVITKMIDDADTPYNKQKEPQ
jgi:hypothetical protein